MRRNDLNYPKVPKHLDPIKLVNEADNLYLSSSMIMIDVVELVVALALAYQAINLGINPIVLNISSRKAFVSNFKPCAESVYRAGRRQYATIAHRDTHTYMCSDVVATSKIEIHI